jgi:hypothetical protein
MKTLHTPGPWVNKGGNSKGQRCISHENQNDVVFIAGVEIPIHDSDNLTKEQAEANAHLIAAAPELLEAAQALGSMPNGYCFCSKDRDGAKETHEPECSNLRNAIAKATGKKEEVK